MEPLNDSVYLRMFYYKYCYNHEYNHNQCLDTIHSEYLFSNKQDIDENEAVLFIRAHML